MSKELSIVDKMPFGKFAGELIGTIIEDEPTYIFWAINNTDLRIDDGAQKYLSECL
jgi:hypothetical protein